MNHRPARGLIPLLVALTLLASDARAEDTNAKISLIEEEVQFTSGDLSLAATLHLPRSTAPVPAVVIIHGSGTSARDNPWTRAYALALVRRGLAVLHPDKRGCGKSQGDWRKSGMLDFAGDAAAAVEFLRQDPRIDPARIGLAGFSQGGSVLPAAAALHPHVAFAIDISGSVIPMAEQIHDEIEMSAERAGLTADKIQILLNINRKGLLYVQSGSDQDWDHYASALQNAKEGALKGHPLVDSFPDLRQSPLRTHIRAILPYDPMEYWKKLTIPMLFIFGGNDTRLRVPKSIERLQSQLPNTKYNYTVLLFSQNGHALYRDDLCDMIKSWILETSHVPQSK